MKNVHFLVKRGSGWYAPRELESDDPSGAALVVPVEDGILYPEYELDVLFPSIGRKTIKLWREKNDVLRYGDLEIGARFARYGKALPYLGKLAHLDLGGWLVEIVQSSVSEPWSMVVDGMETVIVGCDPFENYK